jgi:hypothetical protein
LQVIGARHQDARGAEPALKRVMPLEGRLQIAQRIAGGQSLDRIDTPPVRLHGEQQAGTTCDAIDMNRARATYSVLAANMSPGCSQLVSDEIRKQLARFADAVSRHAIQLHRNAAQRS